MALKKVSIRIPEKMDIIIQKLIEAGFYADRSEFFRQAARVLLEKHGFKPEEFMEVKE